MGKVFNQRRWRESIKTSGLHIGIVGLFDCSRGSQTRGRNVLESKEGFESEVGKKSFPPLRHTRGEGHLHEVCKHTHQLM